MTPFKPLWIAVALLSWTASTASAASQQSVSGPIDPARLSAEVKVLASDDYEGRAPGTEGEAKTIAHLVSRFKALGLEPAGDAGGFVQTVPLLHTQIKPNASVSVRIGGKDHDPEAV